MCFDQGCNLATAIGTIIGAFGTIAVVIYALYKDFWNKPKLECNLEEELYSTKLVYPNNNVPRKLYGSEPRQYCRLKIFNSGRSSLKTVEVMITDLKKIVGDDFITVDKFSPDNLIWSFLGKRQLDGSIEDQIYCPFISPGTNQLCNLGFIVDSYSQTTETVKYDFGNRIFELSVRFKSTNLHYILAEGQYYTEITIGAENADAKKKYFHMTISKGETKFLIEEIPLSAYPC
jgi:hypothetical protein